MSVVRSGLTLSGAPSFPLKKWGVGAVEWAKIGQGVNPGIGDYLPGGKSCRGHLEDEDDSQGHRRPLPCPLI